MFEHRHNLCGFVARTVKILTKACAEIFGFANVDNLPVAVEHHINAGIFRHVFEFRFEVHGVIIPFKAKIVNRFRARVAHVRGAMRTCEFPNYREFICTESNQTAKKIMI